MEEVFYGVYIPPELLVGREEPVPTVYTDISSLNKVMKEFKGSRFKRFTNEVEAVDFTTSNQPIQDNQMISTPGPGESCPFKSLKPQELVKFRKAIEANNIEFIQECTRLNPRYLMTPSDNPSILQEGSRYNALHVAAKFGRAEAAGIILDLVKGELTGLMYPEEELTQNLRRRDHLYDLYLNCAEKGGGDTPLHLAAKFGKLEMVELLTSQPGLSTAKVNKFGEKAADVVCSRMKEEEKEVETKIRDLINGMHYIPIYKEFDLAGPSILGEPVPQSEWTQHKNNLNQSVNQSSPGLSSPRTPVSSRSFNFAGNSPISIQSPIRSPMLTRSPLFAGSPRCFTSPLNGNDSLNGGSMNSPLMETTLMVSAVLGPVNQERAASLYKEIKTCPAKQRLRDPARGLERQCDDIARKVGSDWKEFWPFLGDYVNLTSQEGLLRLEDYLVARGQELARMEEEERCREVDEYDNDDCFLGELELATTKPDSLDDLFKNLGVASPPSKQPFDTPTSQTPISESKTSVTDDIPSRATSQPLSPVTVLSSNLNHLNIDLDDREPRLLQGEEEVLLDRSRQRRPSQETKELVSQFSFMFSNALTETNPSVSCDPEIQDWGFSLLTHWETLRRHVNNMRSDPQGRWNGLDYSGLLRRVVEGVVSELEMEVEELELTKIQALLDRLASFKLSNTIQATQAESDGSSDYREIRRQDSGVQKDLMKLKEIQPLARIIVYFLENRSFPEKESLCAVWDMVSVNKKVSTNRVNKARKFLHSKVFSGSESSDHSRESISDDFSWFNNNSRSLDHYPPFGDTADSYPPTFADLSENIEPAVPPTLDTNGDWRSTTRKRTESGGSEGSSQYATPPSSPTPSSMVTADEGVTLWLQGLEPTQTDRQVFDALRVVSENKLSSFPNLHMYLLNLKNFKENEMKVWPGRPRTSRPNISNINPRKLDLNASF